MILVIALYALLASTFSIGKILLQFTTPLFLIAIRMIIAGIILLIASLFMGGKISIKKQDVGLFWIASLIHILIPYATEFWALQYLTPSESCLFYNLTPFFTALFSYFIFHEIITPKKWLGFIIGFFGIMYFVQVPTGSLGLHFSVVNLIMIISVMTSSLGWILIRLLVKHRGYSPLYVNAITMLLGGVGSIALSYYYEPQEMLAYESIPTFLGMLFLMILIANIIFYNLYGYLLKSYTATFLSFAGFITPLFAAFFERIIFGTTIPTHFFVCLGIVSIGIFIFYHEELHDMYKR